MKVVFTGGGTAGHVSPNIAIIEELIRMAKKRGIFLDILYVGRMRGIERDIVLQERKRLIDTGVRIKYRGIFSGKFRRYADWRNLTDPPLALLGVLQSLAILLSFRPGVVFAKGGFVTVPIGIACGALRIPLIIHESDSVLGLSNKILLRFASKIALGFPAEFYESIPIKKSFFAGNPVRREIREPFLDKKQLCEKYGFEKMRPIILVLGGSQGAQRLNELIDSILEKLLEKYVVVHSAGEKAASYFKEKRVNMDEYSKENYLAYSFIKEEMGDFLHNADLVVSRAGANAISEIIFSRKVSIIIPFPYGAGDHQRKNALFLHQEGIASVLEEQHLTAYKLLEEIEYLLCNKKEQTRMLENMEKVFPPDSAKIIAEELLKYAKA